jgi:glycerol-3-phosphate cytidylyltransferase
MKKYNIGYTQGTFDLFHMGHLNLLKNAKERCNYLIVGVNSNELVKAYKNKNPIINDIDRAKIVEAIKYVDEVHIVDTLDKISALDNYKFDAIFIGSDWTGNERWIKTEIELNKKGVKVEFLPHTDGISTTIIRERMDREGIK